MKQEDINEIIQKSRPQWMKDQHETDIELFKTLKQLQSENARLKELLLDCCYQGCHEDNGLLDSCAISTWEQAFSEMERMGMGVVVGKGRMFFKPKAIEVKP